jgi:photosystem II stability/assembly factor-like uncharacterized protein
MMMASMRAAIVLLLITVPFAQSQRQQNQSALKWIPQESHTKESLRGLSVVLPQIVWASGTHGTYLRTTDGGTNWTPAQVPGAESLDFRDVEAFDSNIAYLLAAGPGEQSRIYKTQDAGKHWDLQFTNHEPKGFFDCMSFWSEQRGIALGDPVNGKFQIITTQDGGKHWNYVDSMRMPAALTGEGAFAASGACIATEGKNNAWFATGGSGARVFRSADGGRSWDASETPIAHGAPSMGIFSIAFRDSKHGAIAGGDYQQPSKSAANLATTSDGGKTWQRVAAGEEKYFSEITYVPGQKDWIVAVGSSASAFSQDELNGWRTVLSDGFNTISSRGAAATWAAGAQGNIAKAVFSSPRNGR